VYIHGCIGRIRNPFLKKKSRDFNTAVLFGELSHGYFLGYSLAHRQLSTKITLELFGSNGYLAFNALSQYIIGAPLSLLLQWIPLKITQISPLRGDIFLGELFSNSHKITYLFGSL